MHTGNYKTVRHRDGGAWKYPTRAYSADSVLNWQPFWHNFPFSYSTGYGGTEDTRIVKFNENGDVVWSVLPEPGSAVVRNGVAGVDGYFYYTVDTEGDIWKLSPNGSNFTSFASVAFHTIYGLAIDSDGCIYGGTYRTSATRGKVFKYSPVGNLEWEFELDVGNGATDVTLDSDGNVYATTRDYILYKLGSTGDEIWTYTDYDYTGGTGNTVQRVAVDSSGNVYATIRNATAEKGEIYKINISGVRQWKYDNIGTRAVQVGVMSNDDIAAGGYEGEVKRINPSGADVWTETYERVNSLAVDMHDYIYIGVGLGHTQPNTNKFHKINPNGTETWQYLHPDNHSLIVSAVEPLGIYK